MSRKTSVCIIIEKHSVTFTFKYTFVYKNVTGSDYILHRTKKTRKLNLSNERLFVMKLKRAKFITLLSVRKRLPVKNSAVIKRCPLKQATLQTKNLLNTSTW